MKSGDDDNSFRILEANQTDHQNGNRIQNCTPNWLHKSCFLQDTPINQYSSTTLPEKVTETPFQETSVQETTTEDKLYIYNGNKNVGYCVFYNQ